MFYPVRFFVGNEYLGEGQCRTVFIHGDLAPPLSFAFFCPLHGDIWARAVVADRPWQMFRKLCPKHEATSYYDVPGSIWLALEPEYLAAMPRSVLLREFTLHLNHYERYHP